MAKLKMTGSPIMSIASSDLVKVAKGAAVAAAGAALTYIAEWVSGADFGQYTPAVVAIAGVLVNLARKWLFDTTSVVALFLAFVLPLSACQAACRHITPMPEKYPHDGQPVVVAMATGFDNFWSDVPEIEYGAAIWDCENAAGRCWSRGDRVVATFDRRRNLFAIRDVLPCVPVLFDRETGSKLL